ncbi:MAG: hypothetical protein INH41_01370 [Myxococcaceae bacterium]|jgi:hypothetical protein|nr:hypothetical protein [Myxococcaceae bacterium]
MLALSLWLVLNASPGVLQGAQVRQDRGVVRSPVVRDGRAEYEGAPWDSQLAAILQPDGVLEWDLGEVKPIEAALLQGDNNDDFILWGSVDGSFFSPLWRAPQDAMAGLRTRTTTSLKAQARYLRLTAEGGDRMYSIGELMVFSKAGELTDDVVRREPLPPPGKRADPQLDGSLVISTVMALAAVAWFWTRRQAVLRRQAPAGQPSGDGGPQDEPKAP